MGEPVVEKEAIRTPSRWNGLTTEERQRERRQLLIDAAYELLSGEGAAGTTVRAVCAHARLNPRYFYESFEDLDSLLVAVYDQVVRQLRTAVSDAIDAATDLDGVMRATVEATVRFIAEDQRRGRVLYAEALGNEALNRRRVETGVGLVELIQRDATRRFPARADEAVARLGAAVLVGGFSELLVAWLDGRIQLDEDELIDAATAVFIAIRDTTGRIAGERTRTR